MLLYLGRQAEFSAQEHSGVDMLMEWKYHAVEGFKGRPDRTPHGSPVVVQSPPWSLWGTTLPASSSACSVSRQQVSLQVSAFRCSMMAWPKPTEYQ